MSKEVYEKWCHDTGADPRLTRRWEKLSEYQQKVITDAGEVPDPFPPREEPDILDADEDDFTKLTDLKKDALVELAKDLEGFNKSLTKAELIELIEAQNDE